MDADAGEVALGKELVQFGCAAYGAHEDHDLVELELVEQIDQFAVLLRLRHLDVVLLQAVQRQLRAIVDVNLQRLSIS